jgi:hypothetical protein
MEKWQSRNQNSNSIIHEIAQNGCWDFLEAMSPEGSRLSPSVTTCVDFLNIIIIW